MRCFVKHIGIIDKKDKIHSVEFFQGVNIITGKSSTGKSAILEIFDYCFGSSDDSLPVGVITENANYYFSILRIVGSYLILARKRESNNAYIIEQKSLKNERGDFVISSKFFEKYTARALIDFKKELGRYFNVTMTSVDEEPLTYYQKRKKSTPSIRSFMSYILQHQNLIANKHALFYRFDEKEKREQAIEHLPIFLGFANQEYYILKQELYEIESKLKKISYTLPKKNDEKIKNISELNYLLNTYHSISGVKLIDQNVEDVIKDPTRWVESIRRHDIRINSASNQNYEQLKKYEQQRTEIYSKKRSLERERTLVRGGMESIDDYTKKIEHITHPDTIEIHVSNCPFCHQQNQDLVTEANDLQKAVSWLNNELSTTPYTRESFEQHDKELSDNIEKINSDLKKIDYNIDIVNKQNELLSKGDASLIDLVNESKCRILFYLEKIIKNEKNELLEEKEKLEILQKEVMRKLKSYNVEYNMSQAEKYLNSFMNNFGNKLDFEDNYKPINLKFSFDSFDLWHEKDDGKKVFLRSMGSGANWLYCHLSLFVGLQRLFCYLGEDCKIPPILFLDQPSQVYFPSIDVSAHAFMPENLSDKKGEHIINHDMNAVKDFFGELIKFCDETKLETNYKPQIIISDHADNIKFDNDIDFESYVRARWRDRGFIDPIN